MAYREDLLDPKWQKKRLKIFERDKWTCQFCGSKKKTLAVHHKKYLKGKRPWQYPDKLLTTACEPCHTLLYKKDLIREKLAELEGKITEKFNRKLSREIDHLHSLLE
jgi:hypothetical protein